MDLICGREVFQSGIAAVQNVVGAKISNPIVENILITAKKDGVSFTATNLTLSVRYEAEAKVATPGQITVPARVVGGLIQDLVDEEVSLSLSGGTLVVVNGRSRFRINGLPAEDFPEFLPLVEGERFQLPVARFRQLVQRTAFAASPEKSRFELDGVKFDPIDGGLRLVATDGRRLCQADLLDEAVTIARSVLVPSRTARESLRVLPAEGEVEITCAPGKVMFSCGKVVMVSSLLQDNFPPYEQIIPKSTAYTATIVREDFLRAVRNASVVAGDRASLIRFQFAPGELKVNAEQASIGEAETIVAIEYDGDEMVIGYQSQYVIDVLRVLDGEKVSIGITDSRSPGVVRQVGDDTFLYVIMPMRLPEQETDPTETADDDE